MIYNLFAQLSEKSKNRISVGKRKAFQFNKCVEYYVGSTSNDVIRILF